MSNSQLTKRLYKSILGKFDGDKGKACRYLNEKCMFYAIKSSQAIKQNNKHASQWRKIYESYNSARFQMDYYLGLDEEFDRDLDEHDLFPIESGQYQSEYF